MKRFMKRTALAILAGLVFLISTARAQSEPSPWRQFGPGGGSISSVAVDPRDPSVLYAAAGGSLYSSIGLVYKSTNGGRTWQLLLGEGFGFHVVAVDPDHPDIVLAGGLEMRRSTDGGQTWQPVLSQGLSQSVQDLTMAPGGLAFAGTYERLLRSVDSGASWSEVLKVDGGVKSIEVDPDDPSRAYAVIWEAFSSDVLYVSRDAGAHWTRGVRPGTGYITRLALAPSSPETLFALIEGRQVFRSDDRAATWRLVGELPNSQKADVLLVDPRSSSTVYAAGDGVFTSLDGGKTWVRSNLGLPRPGHAPLKILSLAVAPSQPEILFAGTLGWGVARRKGAGDSWQIGFENGLTAAWVTMLDFHPRKPGTVYLALNGSRSFRSTDNGRTWQPFARDVAQDGLGDLAFDPKDPNLLYAAAAQGTWKSTDAGETWKKLSSEGGRYIALTGRGVLLSAGCGMKRSTDGGLTWRRVIDCTDEDGKAPRDPLALLVDSKDLNTVYVRFYVSDGSGHQDIEIYKSQNGGRTWKLLRFPGAPSLFAMAPSDTRILYVVIKTLAVEESLLRSVDGGETWTVVNRHFPQAHSLFGEMEVDGADPDKLYLAVSNGILVSRDGGRSFELFDEPLEREKRGTSELWTDRTQPGLVFASPSTGGLFVRRFE